MAKKAQDKLKLCPFCADNICKPTIVREDKWVVIRCGVCLIQMRVYTKYLYQAVAHWNRRNI